MSDEHDLLEEKLKQAQEDLFLCRQDAEQWRTENVALKNFIQTLYENCEGLKDTELTLEEVLNNLKQNIRVFARAHRIRL